MYIVQLWSVVPGTIATTAVKALDRNKPLS